MLTLWKDFDDLFGDDLFKTRRLPMRSYVPAVDIEETEAGYKITADVPGMAPEDVDVTVAEGVLTLKGERRSESETAEGGYRRIERSFGSFRRSFTLPKGVNPEGVEARVTDGVLRILVPKPVAEQPRKITVQATGSHKDRAA